MELRMNCKRGHALVPENVAVVRGKVRQCKACASARRRASREAVRARGRVNVACPKCGLVRSISPVTAARLRSMPRLCASCSRKAIRKGMFFQPRECAKCGKRFAGRSGAARFCDACAGREPRKPRECEACGREFIGYLNKKACSESCKRRLRVNESYFGGRLFEAEGWDTKTCQLCERHVAKKAHVHHVFGHPDHSALVVLCAGCHDVVSTLAHRATYGDEQFRRLRWFVNAQRNGCAPAGLDPEKWTGARGEAPGIALSVTEIKP